MRLGIDLDGVVTDFSGGWIRRYNADFGTDIDPNSHVPWGGATSLTHFADMHDFWEWVRNDENETIFRHLRPYDGAIEALEDLARRHAVVIVTSKPGWAVHDTFAWIAEHRIPTREVHVTRRKWEVGVDIFLDDAPHVLEELVRRRSDAVVCRYVRSWNDEVGGAIDVEDWDQFRAVVRRLAQLR